MKIYHMLFLSGHILLKTGNIEPVYPRQTPVLVWQTYSNIENVTYNIRDDYWLKKNI